MPFLPEMGKVSILGSSPTPLLGVVLWILRRSGRLGLFQSRNGWSRGILRRTAGHPDAAEYLQARYPSRHALLQENEALKVTSRGLWMRAKSGVSADIASLLLEVMVSTYRGIPGDKVPSLSFLGWRSRLDLHWNGGRGWANESSEGHARPEGSWPIRARPFP